MVRQRAKRQQQARRQRIVALIEHRHPAACLQQEAAVFAPHPRARRRGRARREIAFGGDAGGSQSIPCQLRQRVEDPALVDDVHDHVALTLCGNDHMLRVDVAGELILQREAQYRGQFCRWRGGHGDAQRAHPRRGDDGCYARGARQLAIRRVFAMILHEGRASAFARS